MGETSSAVDRKATLLQRHVLPRLVGLVGGRLEPPAVVNKYSFPVSNIYGLSCSMATIRVAVESLSFVVVVCRRGEG